MNKRWIRILYLKEMLDLLRDRRTLISMIVVPLAMMPLIALVMNYFVTKSVEETKTKKYKVALRQEAEVKGLEETLEEGGFEIVKTDTPQEDVKEKKAMVGIEVLPPPEGEGKGKKIVRVLTDQSKLSGKTAQARILKVLGELMQDEMKKSPYFALIADIIKPFEMKMVNVASPRKMAGSYLGRILGYFIIILMVSGGMYAAIDMTAGEKERRTLEILLSSPANREDIVLSKLLATTTVTFVTAILTLVSFGITFYAILDEESAQKLFGGVTQLPLDVATLTILSLSVLPLAVLCSSLLIAIATLAKSFKEAQSYLTPLIMVIVLPAMVGTIPGMKLDFQLALIPVVNFSQFIKELLLGEWTWVGFYTTLGANIVYAGAAFWFTVRIFKSEKVLFRT